MTLDDQRQAEQKSLPPIVVDPSDAVTGLGFVLGLVGAAIGIVAAILVTPQIEMSTVLHCFIGGLAGGSAGLVTGGMIGAVFSVVRGTRR